MAYVFDLHCDTPINITRSKFNYIVPEKLHQENYLGAVFAHFIRPKAKHPFVDAVKMLSSTLAYADKKEKIQIITSPKKIDRKKVNILLGIEGGHIFDNTFKQFEAFYDIGVRVFTLTWNNSNKLAYSALEADKKGLTKKGKQFIQKMKGYDIIIDLSHASTRSVLDVCEVCDNQVIASHSCVRALNKSFHRNIADRAIKAIVEKSGLIGVNFSKYHLGGHSVVDHVDYLKENFGIDAVAIGSDFDGINDPVIENPSGLRELEKQLLKKGYTRTEVEKIFSGNFLRIFKKIEKL
ncbi:MAG: membrane dipeptidase [bacterium]